MTIWLTQEQAAELIGSKPRWVRRLAQQGKLVSKKSEQKKNGNHFLLIALESLPLEAQSRWEEENRAKPTAEQLEQVFIEQRTREQYRVKAVECYAEMTEPQRRAWVRFASHLRDLLGRAEDVKPKKVVGPEGRTQWSHEFNLCAWATATNEPEILKRWPSYGKPVKPQTLYNWIREYPEKGDLVFLPPATRGKAKKADDKRRAQVSPDVIEWLKAHWATIPSQRGLWEAVAKLCIERGEDPPSYSWVRKWLLEVPKGERVRKLEGVKKYNDKLKGFTPRDYRDLLPLQVVCGDHMLADVWCAVAIQTPEGTTRHIVVRPWLTSWQDLRTGLIWGWHVSFQPNSDTAIAAYMNGVRTWGAQPPGSWRYVDNGKDYRSKKMSGQTITVHNSFVPEEGDPFLYVDVQMGTSMVEDLNLKTLFADPYAAWQKVIERTHLDLHRMEMHRFWDKGYCGSTPEKRPDNAKELYKKHKKLVAKGLPSPFPTFEEYREAMGEFIAKYNQSTHERETLGGEIVVPEVEFNKLQTARYTLSETAMQQMGMSVRACTIRKNMVRLESLYFTHEKFKAHVGTRIEVRYRLDDLSSVTCRLPNGEWVTAQQQKVRGVVATNFEEIRARREAETRERILLAQAHRLINEILSTESIEERIAVGQERKVPLIQIVTRYDQEGAPTPQAGSAEVFQYRKPIGWKPGDDDFDAPVIEQPGVRPIFDPWALPDDEEFDDAEPLDL